MRPRGTPFHRLLQPVVMINPPLCVTPPFPKQGVDLAKKATAVLATPVAVPNRDLWTLMHGLLASLAAHVAAAP